jgi:hypothetical protein
MEAACPTKPYVAYRRHILEDGSSVKTPHSKFEFAVALRNVADRQAGSCRQLTRILSQNRCIPLHTFLLADSFCEGQRSS